VLPLSGRRGLNRVRPIAAGAASLTLAAAVALVGAPEVAAQATVRIAAYNIKHGEGMDGQVDLSRAAEVLRALDPDVVTLQEIDRGTDRTDGVDQAARLAEALGMTAHFGAFMPYQGGAYGMAVLTRLPVAAVENIRLPTGDEPRTALRVTVGVGDEGRPLSVVGIHLYRTPEERLAQAEALSLHLESVEHPVVLAGDFNSLRGDRILRHLRAAEWQVVDKDGPSFTYPADDPAREIDFVMLRPGSAFEVVRHEVVDERIASDHRPLLVVLRLW
jgi:endonuclease/exonuclease/phosphatase family metal-dependent hydrolase